MDDRAIIYPTMWKKTFVFGCPRDFAIALILLCAPISPLAGVFVGPGGFFIAFGFFMLGWLFGVIMAKNDPEFFSVWLVKVKRIGPTKGDFKGNEYLS